jgi:hypothetical protein
MAVLNSFDAYYTEKNLACGMLYRTLISKPLTKNEAFLFVG